MNGYGKEVRDKLHEAGCTFVRHGRGDHVRVPGVPASRLGRSADPRSPSRRANFEPDPVGVVSAVLA
jgi:hypothetical protein